MAIITVTPATPGGIDGAVNAVTTQPGDVILVENGVYHETVTIPATKSNIRIVADGRRAVLKGNNQLAIAFALVGVSGVEITGFTIKEYTNIGIQVNGNGFNRLVENKLRQIGNDGIQLNSEGNLVYKNDASGLGGDGVDINGNNNWIVKNELCHNNGNGANNMAGNNNTIVQNHLLKNGGNGVVVSGSNSLIVKNYVFQNMQNGIFVVGNLSENAEIVNNWIIQNRKGGVLIQSDNAFVGHNSILENRQSSVELSSSYSIIERNEIRRNGDFGIKINSGADKNLILRNLLQRNHPSNIQDNGADNNFVGNH